VSAPFTVAVAVDGTAASEAALARAVAIARERECALAGVFVVDTGWPDFIGNDWQSSRNARQGFLDYVRGQLEEQGEQARRQFEAAAAAVPQARFEVLAGEPADTLCDIVGTGAATLLFAGSEVFRDCGRPSAKGLARTLARRLGDSVLVI